MEPDHTLPSPLDTPELTQASIDASTDMRPVPLTPARKKQASYGALLSVIVIMAIIVFGAFYAWGKRIHDQGGLVPAATTTQQTY
jgi:hypothetical protein